MIGPKTPKPSPADERRAYDTVTARDGGRCTRCGAYGVTHRDHRQNRRSGNTTPANLQLLCPVCHQWKTEHPTAATAEGFSVPGWARPELWPAWRHAVGWVIYFDAPVDGVWWRTITESTAHLLKNGGA